MNPYEPPSEIIQAELVIKEVRRPANKRHPMLAILFTVVSIPFLSLTVWGWMEVANLAGKLGAPQMPMTYMVGGIFVAITAISWFVPLLCLKEVVQYLRGR